MKSIKSKTKSTKTRKAGCAKKAKPGRTSVATKTKARSSPVTRTQKKAVSISNLKRAIQGIKSNVKQLEKAIGK